MQTCLTELNRERNHSEIPSIAPIVVVYFDHDLQNDPANLSRGQCNASTVEVQHIGRWGELHLQLLNEHEGLRKKALVVYLGFTLLAT